MWQDIFKVLKNGKLCKTEHSGLQTINDYPELKPDIIMFEPVSTDISGFEAARYIKEQNSDIRMVIVSRKFEPEFLELSRSLGLDGYLTGYPDPSELDELLIQLTDQPNCFHIRETLICPRTFR